MSEIITKTRKAIPEKKRETKVQPVLKTDNKGRITLGSEFANKQVIAERISDTEVILKIARVIPESEAWLYDNAVALNSVRKGLAQAQAGEFVEGPDMDADAELAAKLED